MKRKIQMFASDVAAKIVLRDWRAVSYWEATAAGARCELHSRKGVGLIIWDGWRPEIARLHRY